VISLIVGDSGDGVMSLNGDGGGSTTHDVAVSLALSASGDGGGNEDSSDGTLMASSTVDDGGCAVLAYGIVTIDVFFR